MSDDLVNTLQQLADVLQTQRTLGIALANIAEAATVSVPGCARPALPSRSAAAPPSRR